MIASTVRKPLFVLTLFALSLFFFLPPDPSATFNSSLLVRSEIWSIRRLAEWRPCNWWLQPHLNVLPAQTNGYIRVDCYGGLNQMRRDLCDGVGIARLLNATLVLPKFEVAAYWNESSGFEDVFDVDFFIQQMKGFVNVVKELPIEIASKDPVRVDCSKRKGQFDYVESVLPSLLKHGYISITPAMSQRRDRYPLYAKAALCQACYSALRLTNTLEKKAIELLQAIPKPFLSLHLRFEPDMVAYSQCEYSGLSLASANAIEAARVDRKPWTGETARIWRNRGKCPLTPNETAFILEALAIPTNTTIYLAAGDGLMELEGLTSVYTNVVTKSSLLSGEDFTTMHGNTKAALDYYVSINSDSYMATYFGNMDKMVAAMRAFKGLYKTIFLNRKRRDLLHSSYLGHSFNLTEKKRLIHWVYRRMIASTVRKPLFVLTLFALSLFFFLPPDPSATFNSSLLVRSEIWSIRRLAEWRPCNWWLQPHLNVLPAQTNGYIRVDCYGGLNQMRRDLCDGVGIARLLNATLVLPKFEVAAYWNESSGFEDVFDVDFFIQQMKGFVNVVKELPIEIASKDPVRVDCSKRKGQFDYVESVLPSLLKHGYISITPAMSQRRDRYPLYAKAALCQACYSALRLTNTLEKKAIELLQAIPKPFLSLHLRFEPDMVAYSQCEYSGLSLASANAIEAARVDRKPWTGETARIWRNRGKCPLTPNETAFILEALAIPTNTTIYLAAGDGLMELEGLTSVYTNVVTKSSLLSGEDFTTMHGNTKAALDYYVSINSDSYMATYFGNMDKMVAAMRAFKGLYKTIFLNRKRRDLLHSSYLGHSFNLTEKKRLIHWVYRRMIASTVRKPLFVLTLFALSLFFFLPPDPSATFNSSLLVRSEIWSIRRLAEWRPCNWWLQPHLNVLPAQTNGYIRVDCYGGLNQMRRDLCDGVGIARLLNATLVLPKFEVAAYWNESSGFEDVFDVDFFIQQMKGFVNVVKELPIEIASKDPVRVDCSKRKGQFDYVESVLPSLLKHGYISITPAMSQRRDRYPLYAKAALCQACYSALRLTNTLEKKAIELLQAIPKPFLSLHLRFEPDMVAYSQCEYSGLSLASANAIEAARVDRKPWTGETARIWRNRGKCPLTPNETAFILEALAIPTNTTIYLAAGDGLMELEGLTSVYTNVVTKSSLLSGEDFTTMHGNTKAALDYYVSINSDSYMATYFGNMDKMVAAMRAFKGLYKTIFLNRKRRDLLHSSYLGHSFNLTEKKRLIHWVYRRMIASTVRKPLFVLTLFALSLFFFLPPDPSATFNSSLLVRSEIWSIRRLAEWRPCNWWLQPHLNVLPAQTNGYIRVDCYGGLNQMRRDLCDGVGIARLLNATLVLPKFEVAAYWNESSGFEDVFDVDFFIQQMKGFVNVVKELPIEIASKDPVRVDCSKRKGQFDYVESVLPSLLKHGYISITPAMSQRRDRYPLYAKAALCQACYSALRLTNTLEKKAIELLQAIPKPFLSLHLRFEPDMVAYSQCEYSGLSLASANAIEAARVDRKPWTGETARIWRNRGKCPLTPNETAFILEALAIPTNTTIYLAAGDGLMELEGLTSVYTNVVTKSSLLSGEDFTTMHGNTKAALDYYVSINSDSYMATYFGNMDKMVAAMRAFKGLYKTIFLNRKRRDLLHSSYLGHSFNLTEKKRLIHWVYRRMIASTVRKPLFVLTLFALSLFFFLPPDPSATFNSSLLVRSEIWSIRRLAEWRPCNWWLQPHLNVLPAQTNGYIRVDCYGGLNQMRRDLCDGVGIARLLNATLVLPKFEVAAYWNESSGFEDVFDVDFFIQQMKGFVNVVKELPIEIASKDPVRVDCSKRKGQFDYVESVLPSLLKHGYISITPAMSQRRDRYPLYAKAALCQACYSALRLTNTLEKKAIELLQAIPKPFLSLHLRFEPDMVAYSQCEYSGLSLASANAIEAARVDRKPWTGETARIWRNRGKCPLTPNETAFILEALAIPTNTTIYLAAGDGLMELEGLTSVYTNVVTKSSLLSGEDFTTMHGNTKAALDYYVSINSDSYMATYFGNMDKMVAAMRAFKGLYKTIFLNRKRRDLLHSSYLGHSFNLTEKKRLIHWVYRRMIASTVRKPLFVLTLFALSLFFFLPPDPSATFNSSLLVRSEIWSIRRLAEWRPCNWWLQPHLNVLPAQTNGYIRVDCYGGLNQMRRDLCDGVGIARLLNATLVLPKFEVAAYWNESSGFEDVFDVDFFIQQMKGFVNVVKELPIEIASKDPVRVDCSKRKGQFDYVESVLPSLLKHGYISITPAMSQRRDRYPLYAKAALCQACYSALRLTNTLEKKAIELLQAIPKPFLSLHLRFEPDMVAYSQCEYSGLSLASANAIEAARVDRKPWTGETARIWRNRGKCPLTPNETAFILEALAIPTNTTIYLAAGDGLMELEGLTSVYTNVVTKSSLLSGEDFTTMHGNTKAALDYYVSINSDSYMATYFGNMDKMVAAMRAFKGLYKTIFLNRKRRDLLHSSYLGHSFNLTEKKRLIHWVYRRMIASTVRKPLFVLTLFALSLFFFLPPDPSATFNSSLLVRSEIWSIRRLAEWRPCNWWLQPHLNVLPAQTNGYILVDCYGGLNQMRRDLCDGVGIARLLNATLVLPKFEVAAYWNESSGFEDVFDVDFFIQQMKGFVNVVKELPIEIASKDPVRVDCSKRKGQFDYVESVLPSLLKHGYISITPAMSQRRDRYPLYAKAALCQACYSALRLTNTLEKKAIELLQAIPKPFLSLHLRFEPDMVAYSQCEYSGLSLASANAIEAARVDRKPWTGETARIWRNRGKCPLTPNETAFILEALAIPTNTTIYLAAGDGLMELEGLTSVYTNVVTKSSLLSGEDFTTMHGNTKAALDYYVSINSDSYMATYFGNMDKMVAAMRAFKGLYKTIFLNRKRRDLLHSSYLGHSFNLTEKKRLIHWVYRRMIASTVRKPLFVLTLFALSLFFFLPPDPSATFNSSLLVRSEIWSIRRLAEWRPCNWWLQPHLNVLPAQTNGYIRVDCYGGLNQMRRDLCDGVGIARLLNATLVLPKFEVAAYWNESSGFEDVFDVDFFIQQMKGFVNVVKELPIEIASKDPVRVDCSKRKGQFDYVESVLPSLLKHGYISITPAMSQRRDRYPLYAKAALCQACYSALRLTNTLEKKAIELLQAIPKPFLSLHLRFEPDMVAYSQCEYSGLSLASANAIEAARVDRKPWTGETARIWRNRGKCPLTPNETAFILEALAIPTNTTIYLAAGDGLMELEGLTSVYTNVVTKSSLLSGEDFTTMHGNTKAALDYYVSINSDSYMATYFGNMDKMVAAMRAFKGLYKTIFLNRKAFALLTSQGLKGKELTEVLWKVHRDDFIMGRGSALPDCFCEFNL